MQAAMNSFRSYLEKVNVSPAADDIPRDKNAGLVGPAASLLLICGERLVYVLGPRGSF
jgi:hypothetical protein